MTGRNCSQGRNFQASTESEGFLWRSLHLLSESHTVQFVGPENRSSFVHRKGCFPCLPPVVLVACCLLLVACCLLLVACCLLLVACCWLLVACCLLLVACCLLLVACCLLLVVVVVVVVVVDHSPIAYSYMLPSPQGFHLLSTSPFNPPFPCSHPGTCRCTLAWRMNQDLEFPTRRIYHSLMVCHSVQKHQTGKPFFLSPMIIQKMCQITT